MHLRINLCHCYNKQPVDHLYLPEKTEVPKNNLKERSNKQTHISIYHRHFVQTLLFGLVVF